MLFKVVLISALSMLSLTHIAKANESKGLEIAVKMDQANEGFLGETSTLEMTLIDAHGTKIIRKMQGMTLEVKGDGDKSVSTFLIPADVKGINLLTWAHKTDDDDQWLYLPSLKRVKRISSSNKSASFQGSEFAYEDIGSQEVEKYTYKYIKEEMYKDKKVWVVERYPISKKSGYKKQLMWIGQSILNPYRIDYYDRKNELLKISTFDGHKTFKVRGKVLYRPSSITMKNVQTKKQSILEWKERKLGVNLDEDDFNKSSLKDLDL